MQVKKIHDVEAIRGGEMHKGDLHLAEHHVVFVMPSNAPADAKPPPSAPKTRELYIAYPVINYCNFRPSPPASGRPSTIRIRCRDFMFISFHFKDDVGAREAFECMRNRTTRLGKLEKLYAFSYQPLKQEKPFNGWEIYDPKTEYRRQGISSKSQDRGWRISNINKDYSFSPTYPGLLVVPSQISDNVLKHAGPYRSRHRIPVLTYLHSLNNCSITRSSQPCVGLRGNRSPQDEKIVSASFSASATVEFNGLDVPGVETAEPSPSSSQADIRDPNMDSETLAAAQLEDELLAAGDPNFDPKTGKRLIFGAQQSNLIVDARPTINALAMQAMGKGSENMDHYNFAKKAYLNIDNIHVMRESLNTVIEAIKDGDISKLPPNRDLLQKSAWLKHITGVLDGSALIARQVGIRHSHVLIHCSDGWDRTSQLSALSQLMLDPFYRTIEGFIILIEKDWLSFGHMFHQRSGPLGHEKWFTVERDTAAGGTLQPGESDGRAGEALEKAFASATRFFNKKSTQKDEGAESDESPTDETSQGKKGEGEATRPNEISPVFHQFLDATYQIYRQHPTRFEFNERFIRRLLYHLYSAQYGTFLWNSEKMRMDDKAAERTRSVWDYFLSRKQEFSNPEYDPTVDDRQSGRERLILPRLSEIRWWASCFGRTDAEMNDYLEAAAARGERVNNYSNNVTASSAPGSRSRSPAPTQAPTTPGLKTSTTVLTSVETAHEALTPEYRAREGHASLQKSASADSPGAFASNLAKLRDGVAGLDIGMGGLFGGQADAKSAQPAQPAQPSTATENSRAVTSNTGERKRLKRELSDMPMPTPPLGDNRENGLEMK